ncbi:MAG: thiamine-phosphate kinase [Burkholderiales bacterium]
MLSEFELIRRYFDRPARGALLGIGDDAALVKAGPGMAIAVSTDMLLEGRHFSVGAEPGALGHKALAVNLSDMAAMGATPRWATLALALPRADEVWLAAFSAGLHALADRYEIDLIGGDTTRGSLAMVITILGEVPEGCALLRSGAREADEIWVSGELGGAALALAHLQERVQLTAQDAAQAAARLHTPEPRVALGQRLRGIASSAIDLSDGFAGDLQHVLESSSVAAQVRYASLPRFAAFARLADPHLEADCVLSGGDDYELLFTAAPARRAELEALGVTLDVVLTRVGSIRAGAPKLELLDAASRPMPQAAGFDHFRA